MVRPSIAVLALTLLLAAASAARSPAAAQNEPDAVPLPDPGLTTLPQRPDALSLGQDITVSPGVGIQGGFTEDAQDPAPTPDTGVSGGIGAPALGAGEDTNMDASGATISIPLN